MAGSFVKHAGVSVVNHYYSCHRLTGANVSVVFVNSMLISCRFIYRIVTFKYIRGLCPVSFVLLRRCAFGKAPACLLVRGIAGL